MESNEGLELGERGEAAEPRGVLGLGGDAVVMRRAMGYLFL
jgi:hypothetical protein